MLVCVECIIEKVGDVPDRWNPAWTIIDGRALCTDHALDRLSTPTPPPGVHSPQTSL